MVSPAYQSWMRASQIEKQLTALLEDKAPPRFDDVDGLIEQLRLVCETTILADWEYASEKGVERYLWDSHIKINQRYRKILEHFKREDQKKNVVERRKLEKRYVDFIKTSQFFYKGYIQRLASRYELRKLRRIASRLQLEVLSVDQRIVVSPEVERLINISCHVTLLRLGDLSRYRNKLRTKDRSWDAALGYYNLANDFMPGDGSAHNQMAVIALGDGNHLDAVYHLYRALAIKDPHVLAQGNLEIEFKKIRELQDKKRAPTQTGNLSSLVWWFVLLHARFYDGVEFPGHEELESEVLSRLTLLLKEESFRGETLEKIILINFSAVSFAEQRIRDANGEASENLFLSYYFTLALNIRMMNMLLRVLRPELEDHSSGDDLPADTATTAQSSHREKVTVVARRVLPTLRQCAVWLVSLAEVIVGTGGVAPVAIHANAMWKTYADVLTQLVRLHPVESLRSVNYLLEEDETTIGFKPLRDTNLPTECDLYVDDAGDDKPHIEDLKMKRNHPNEEMLARVRDILLCALILHQNPKIPLNFDQSMAAFIFVEEGLAIVASSSPIQAQEPMTSIESSMQSRGDFTVPVTINKSTSLKSAEFVAPFDNSIDDYMHDMVNSLVEPSGSRQTTGNETSYGMHTRTANDVFGSMDTASERHQSPPKMLASLPGVWNSAFTPQPNELKPLSPTCPNTRRPLSPMPLSTVQERLDAAEHLEKITGYRRSSQERLENMTGFPGFRRSPKDIWGGKRASNPTSQAVNNILQQSLAEQFNPMSITSSGFSQSSSLYANNTPLQRQYLNGNVRGPFAPNHAGNNSTFYPGGSDFDTEAMLRSSIWNGSQPQRGNYTQTPPGGQGG